VLGVPDSELEKEKVEEQQNLGRRDPCFMLISQPPISLETSISTASLVRYYSMFLR